ncbi:MAG: helix-turn-helix domain-containing protein [Acidobacteriota bacterium]|nr:helix-turn-helix domain-containing protein [Acidobacteriota bacterium]
MSLIIEYITYRQAAKIIGCSKNTVYNKLAGAGEGKIKVYKRPGTAKHLLDRREVEKYANRVVEVTR